MNISVRQGLFATCLYLPIFASAAFLHPAAAVADSVAASLPDTVPGRLGAELIHQINVGNPEQIGQWVPTILSPAVDDDDRAAFIKGLTSSARGGGGVDLVGVKKAADAPPQNVAQRPTDHSNEPSGAE